MGPQLFFGTSALRKKISTLGLIFNAACFYTLTTAAMLNTFAIAIDRFLFIKRAMTYPSIVTSTRVRIAVFVIWVLAVFIGTISLYDVPFHKIADEGVHQIIPDCENTTVRWLRSRSTEQLRNMSALEQKVGFLEETDMSLLLHQIASCPEAARPALRIQNMILFVAFCVMGFVTIGLYIQVFFVIRNHNKTLATHANMRSSDIIASECDSSNCKICTWYEERVLSARHKAQKVSKTNIFDTALCLKINKPYKQKIIGVSSDLISEHQASSTTGTRSSQHSQNSSSTASFNIGSPNSRDGERRVNRDNSYDSDSNSTTRNNDIIPSESKPAISMRCLERKNRLKLSIRSRFQDMRTVKTLGTMFVIYYICWLPMIICSFILYGLSHPMTEQVLLGAWIMGTSNSVWNFLVYPMRNRELRSTITRLVCFHRYRKSRS